MAMEPVLVPVCIYGFVLSSGGMSTGVCLVHGVSLSLNR